MFCLTAYRCSSSFRTHTSYRATTRYPGIPANGPRIVVRGDLVRRGIQEYPLGHSALDAESRNTRAGNTGKGNTHKRHFSGPRIVVRGDPVCSFFSTARRTNQEAPPLLSGFFARSLSPPSGAAELAVLKQSSPFFLGRLASSRPDKGGVCSALSLCGLTGPRHHVIPRYDAVSRNTRAVIPHLMRNPGIPANGPRIVVRGDSRTGPRIAVRGDPVRRGIQEYPPVGPLNGTVPIDNHRLRLEYIRELHQSPPTSPSTAGFPVR